MRLPADEVYKKEQCMLQVTENPEAKTKLQSLEKPHGTSGRILRSKLRGCIRICVDYFLMPRLGVFSDHIGIGAFSLFYFSSF